MSCGLRWGSIWLPRLQNWGCGSDDLKEQDVFKTVNEVVEDALEPGACHHMQTRRYDTGWAASMHCTLPGDMPLLEAHRISISLELSLRRSLPGLEWVVIHTEPERSPD